MDDLLIGKRIIKDGVMTFVTEHEIWIKQSKDDIPKPPTKVKSKVCHDCDYSYFVNSECEWFCTLTNSFTKGYCEVPDQ
jgi:hypothetical protein